MADRDVLELDRADPLTARLDQVLAAVGDLQVAVGVDRGDVAGVEPAVGVGGVAVGPVVAAADPRPADQQLASRRPVPGQVASLPIDDPQVDAEQGAALLEAAPVGRHAALAHCLRGLL